MIASVLLPVSLVLPPTAMVPASVTLAVAQHPPVSDGGVLTMVACYAFGMIGLTAWDEHVLPKLQDKGMMPTLPGSPRDIRQKRLSDEQRDLPWVTPLTADRWSISAAPLVELQKRAIRVGSSNSCLQLIRAHAVTEEVPPGLVDALDRGATTRPTDGTPFEVAEMGDVGAVCRVSPEFSEAYSHRVYICKQRMDV